MSKNTNKGRPAPVSKATLEAKPVVEATIIDKEGLLSLKEEILRWLLTIAATVLVYIIVAVSIFKNYTPDIAQLKDTAAKFLASPGIARPEPMEATLFRVAVVVILLGLLGFYIGLSRLPFVRKLAQSPFFLVASAGCIAFIAGLIYFDFRALNPFSQAAGEQPQNNRDLVGNTNFDFFFTNFFLGSNLLLYIIIIVPLLAVLFFIGIKKYNIGDKPLFKKGVAIVGYALSAGIILAIIAMNTFHFPYTYENKYDFNAAYYSVTQVYAGAPMLINGFTNTYGLYPELLNPLFHITGLSIFSFSLVMALLVGTAFVFNFYVLQKVVANKIILFLGFFTLVFFSFLDFKLATPFDCLFSQFPIRYIVPCTLVFLATLYFYKRSAALYWATFFIQAFLVLWNPEMGIVSYLSWLAVNTFTDFYDAGGKGAIKKILLHWVYGAVVLMAVLYCYKLAILAIYGASPDLSLLFSTILVFGKVGFGLLPMSLVHPWNITAIILIVGFTYAISKWHKKEITPRVSVAMLVSLIGLGYFFYFQGRSHNWSFAGSTGFCILLLTILTDELWSLVRRYNIFLLNALFALCLVIISFSLFEIIVGASKIREIAYQDDDKDNNSKEEDRINSSASFVTAHSALGEKIFVFTADHLQGLYFNGSKRRSAFNPGNVELFLKTDVERMVHTISDSSFSVFIEPALCNSPLMVRPLAAMAASYSLVDSNQSMKRMGKRKTLLPQESFFGASGTIFHQKFGNDTASIMARVTDAQGAAPIQTGTQFSVEVLFNARPQIYPFATLVGNMNDTSGFIIANILNTPGYFFGVNGKGFSLPVVPGEWNYCVMNVFPDRVEVYNNGALIGKQPLPQPIRPSSVPLFIGNLGYMRYFCGPIAEVALHSNVLNDNQVHDTWENIKTKVTGK